MIDCERKRPDHLCARTCNFPASRQAERDAAQEPAIVHRMNARRGKSLEGKFAEGYHQGIAVFLDLARGQPRTHSLDRSLGTSAMSPIPPRSGSRPSRNDDLLRLGEQAFRFGAEAYGQWWTITGRSLRREVNRLVWGAKALAPPSALLQGLASGYVNWLGELAAMAPSVAEKAAMEFALGSHADPEPFIGGEDAGPATEGDYFEVAGKPFVMPACDTSKSGSKSQPSWAHLCYVCLPIRRCAASRGKP